MDQQVIVQRTIDQPILRPPLPPPLSHEGITFIGPLLGPTTQLTPEILSAIGAALQAVLPPGDFSTDSVGRLSIAPLNDRTRESLWHQAGLLEGISRREL